MVGTRTESAFSEEGEVALELSDTRPELEAEEEELERFIAALVLER